MSKMTIEYVIYGIKSPVPIPNPSEELLDAMKYQHDLSLRRDGVFGEITHRVVDYPPYTNEETGETYPAWQELLSGGKKMTKEIEGE